MATPNGNVLNIGNESNIGHHQSSKMRYNGTYIRSATGIVKFSQSIVSLIAYFTLELSLSKSYHFPERRYYAFVTIFGSFLSFCFGGSHIIHFTDAVPNIPWSLIELVFSFIWTLMYCIAVGIIAPLTSYHPGVGAATFFALVATFLYGYEAVDRCRNRFREGRGEYQRSRGGSCATIAIT